MKRAPLAWLVLFSAFAWIAGATPGPSIASSSVVHTNVCEEAPSSREIVEPPDIDVWTLPVDAKGDHELILAVHREGLRYCYGYSWNGATRTMWPTIRVRRGEHFALRIVNDIFGPSRGGQVSSSLIPPCKPMPMPSAKTTHYVGYLNHTIDDRYMPVHPGDTNIHLHGFEGPADEENIFLSTLSTPMHACEYRVTIPGTQPPGLYMYHPHSHGASGDEVAGGLDGAWIVEPDEIQLPRAAEHVIILRYRIPFLLDNAFAPNEDAFVTEAVAHEAALRAGRPVAYDPFHPPAWPVTFPMRAGGVRLDSSGCNGLQSESVVAVNGADVPATLKVPAQQPQLLRILNGTSDSATQLQMRDSSGRMQPLRVVGLDGIPVSGNTEHPLAEYIAMNGVFLTSMSRADILFTGRPGERYTVSSEHYCEGKDAFFQMHHDLLRITAVPGSGSQTVAMSSRPAVIADTPAARLVAFVRAHRSLVRRRAFTFTEYALPKNGTIPLHDAFFITNTTNLGFHEHPYWPVYPAGATVPSNADIVVKKGSVEEWYLVNATMEAHAFHIHQMTFVQETSPAGIPLTRDTVFVPIGELLPNRRDPNYPLVRPRITKILLDFRNVPRGTFVFHCHMLFHEDRGMMAVIRVV